MGRQLSVILDSDIFLKKINELAKPIFGSSLFCRNATAAARTRTWDHLVNSEALYQLSYDGSSAHPTVQEQFK